MNDIIQKELEILINEWRDTNYSTGEHPNQNEQWLRDSLHTSLSRTVTAVMAEKVKEVEILDANYIAPFGHKCEKGAREFKQEVLTILKK